MQVQLVDLEDSKLMKLYCLESDIHKKMFDSETNHMFASFRPIEYLNFQLLEKKNLEQLKSHLEVNDIKYELVNGILNDSTTRDNWVNIIERPNDFYLLQSKYGCKLITFKKRQPEFKEIKILHLGKELCEIEYSTDETAERIVKKNTRKHKTIDRQTSLIKRVKFNQKIVEKIKEDLEKAKIEFYEIY